jgi:hypothetical protein
MVRYSNIGSYILGAISPRHAGYLTGTDGPLWIPVLLIISFITTSSFISRFIDSKDSKKWAKKILTGIVIIILCLFCFAKRDYAPYGDEQRDIVVVNTIRDHGVSAYTQKDQDNQQNLSDIERQMINMARQRHPPGHYLAGFLIPGGPHSIVFWRYIYGALFCVIMPILLSSLRGRLYTFNIESFLALAVLIFSYTYFRNYTLVRVGNELFPMLFSSMSFLIVFRWLQEDEKKDERFSVFSTWALLALAFFLALSCKYSVLVTAAACVGALLATALIYKSKVDLRCAALTSSAFLLALCAHMMIWWGTDMLELHIAGYGYKIYQILGLPIPEVFQSGQVLDESSSSIPNFILSSPFWFGLPLFFGSLFGIYRYLLKRGFHNQFDSRLIIFLILNLIGVLIVNPRAQYLAPATLPLAYFVWSQLRKGLNIRKYLWVICFVGVFAIHEFALSTFHVIFAN